MEEWRWNMGMELKVCRIRAGMTQKQVAAAIGVAQQQYQRWEMGICQIPIRHFIKIPGILGCTLDDLNPLSKASGVCSACSI